MQKVRHNGTEWFAWGIDGFTIINGERVDLLKVSSDTGDVRRFPTNEIEWIGEKPEMSLISKDTWTVAKLIAEGAHESRTNLLIFLNDECLVSEASTQLKQWLHELPIDAEIIAVSSHFFGLRSTGGKRNCFFVQVDSLKKALTEFCARPDTGIRVEASYKELAEEDSNENQKERTLKWIMELNSGLVPFNSIVEFDCPEATCKGFDLQAEIDSILNRYPKDSQERQDLMRVKDAVTQLRILGSHEDDDDEDYGYDDEDVEDDSTEAMVVEEDDGLNQYTFAVPNDSESFDMDEVAKILVGVVRNKIPISERSFNEIKTGPFAATSWTTVGPITGDIWADAWDETFGETCGAPLGTVILRRSPGQTSDRIFMAAAAADDETGNEFWYEVTADGLTLEYTKSGVC